MASFAPPDPFEILGVDPTASDDEIKRAYRRAIRHQHPDVGGNAAIFRMVQEAWALIGTAEHRARYVRNSGNRSNVGNEAARRAREEADRAERERRAREAAERAAQRRREEEAAARQRREREAAAQRQRDQEAQRQRAEARAAAAAAAAAAEVAAEQERKRREAAEQLKRERLESLERERLAEERRLESERLERERIERERIEPYKRAVERLTGAERALHERGVPIPHVASISNQNRAVVAIVAVGWIACVALVFVLAETRGGEQPMDTGANLLASILFTAVVAVVPSAIVLGVAFFASAYVQRRRIRRWARRGATATALREEFLSALHHQGD